MPEVWIDENHPIVGDNRLLGVSPWQVMWNHVGAILEQDPQPDSARLLQLLRLCPDSLDAIDNVSIDVSRHSAMTLPVLDNVCERLLAHGDENYLAFEAALPFVWNNQSTYDLIAHYVEQSQWEEDEEDMG